jgi:hypothetical protein
VLAWRLPPLSLLTALALLPAASSAFSFRLRFLGESPLTDPILPDPSQIVGGRSSASTVLAEVTVAELLLDPLPTLPAAGRPGSGASAWSKRVNSSCVALDRSQIQPLAGVWLQLVLCVPDAGSGSGSGSETVLARAALASPLAVCLNPSLSNLSNLSESLPPTHGHARLSEYEYVRTRAGFRAHRPAV